MSAVVKQDGRTWPLYVGGFLGPFGAPLVSTMLPELSVHFDVTIEAAGITLTAYLVPFALMMLISGTLAERFGRRRTVQVAYVVYAASALACIFMPTLEWFCVARVVQGMSNAFTTPVLVGAISEIVPPNKLGGALGLFGSMQATGQAMSPLAGGISAALDWRLAFIACAVVAIALAFLPPPNSTVRFTGSSRDRWKSLANPQLALACVIAALAFLTSMGLILITALYVREDEVFGLGPTVAGLIVACFGVAGLLTGRRSGRLMDRFGGLPVGSISFVLLALACFLAGSSAAWPAGLGVAVVIIGVALAGMCSTAGRALTQSLAVTSAPQNRSGASSVMLACQFGGSALAPILWIPFFETGAYSLSLLLTGVPALIAGFILAAVWFRTTRTAQS
jgi:ACDE family multidrug resistance protein